MYSYVNILKNGSNAYICSFSESEQKACELLKL